VEEALGGLQLEDPEAKDPPATHTSPASRDEDK
jgi:hypothetical protein